MWPFRKRGIDLEHLMRQVADAPPAKQWTNLLILHMTHASIAEIDLCSDEPLPRLDEWGRWNRHQELPSFDEVLARFREMVAPDGSPMSPEVSEIQFVIGGEAVWVRAVLTEHEGVATLRISMRKSGLWHYGMKTTLRERGRWGRWKEYETIKTVAVPKVSASVLAHEIAPRGRWYGYLLGMHMHRTRTSDCTLSTEQALPPVGDWPWDEPLPPFAEVIQELRVLCGDTGGDAREGRFGVDLVGGRAEVRVEFDGAEGATLRLEPVTRKD